MCVCVVCVLVYVYHIKAEQLNESYTAVVWIDHDGAGKSKLFGNI